MWPAGLNRSFGGFCGATFVIGSGLGSLESAANPYLTGELVESQSFIKPLIPRLVCGPPQHAEMRINIAQAFNAIGTVVGPVLGSYAFFVSTSDNVHALQRVQWVYLAIGIFVMCLAVVFYFSNIPEITDEDMEFQVSQTHDEDEVIPFWKNLNLFHAAFSQFCYCGAQGMLHYTSSCTSATWSLERLATLLGADIFCTVAIAGYFINYVTETWPGKSSATAAKLLSGAQGTFAVGRFTGAILMSFVKPRWVFLVYLSGAFAFVTASITQTREAGVGKSTCFAFSCPGYILCANMESAMLFMTLFFESVCFPTIVALGIKNLGKNYKRGSGFIVAGVAGGAVVPPILGHVADMRNNTGFAFIVPAMVRPLEISPCLPHAGVP